MSEMYAEFYKGTVRENSDDGLFQNDDMQEK